MNETQLMPNLNTYGNMYMLQPILHNIFFCFFFVFFEATNTWADDASVACGVIRYLVIEFDEDLFKETIVMLLAFDVTHIGYSAYVRTHTPPKQARRHNDETEET